MYNISLYQNLATNKVTLVITTSSDYTLQLNWCQIEDGQCHISFLNITKERTQNLAANKYKHISARTIYWLPKNPAIKHEYGLMFGNYKETWIKSNEKEAFAPPIVYLNPCCIVQLQNGLASNTSHIHYKILANPIDGIDGSIHITTNTQAKLFIIVEINYKETWIKSNEKEAFAPPIVYLNPCCIVQLQNGLSNTSSAAINCGSQNWKTERGVLF
ncbi:hypothetical protein ACJX0J_010384, partial [Zea mays]